MKSTLTVAALLGLAVSLAAQTPPAQAPPAQQRQGGAPAGQRGGGRGGGRGGIQVLTLSTSAWLDGGLIPLRYTQAGAEMSPPLKWSDWVVPPPPAPNPNANAAPAPPQTNPFKSFVVIVHDLDAPSADLTTDMLHWMVWNIPATSHSLPEHVPEGGDRPDGSRQISATGPYYRGPAAPATGPLHHYVFDLYALDAMIDVPAVGAPVAQTRAAVMTAMAGHVRGKATMVGRFKYASAIVAVKK
jgi:Raf kinase inhibitor-like YbhB/YbcL family protein